MDIPHKLSGEISRLKFILEECEEALEKFGIHGRDCILSFQEAGEPTKNGGYRVKYKGKWYQSRPADERPKCECGLDEIIQKLRTVKSVE